MFKFSKTTNNKSCHSDFTSGQKSRPLRLTHTHTVASQLEDVTINDRAQLSSSWVTFKRESDLNTFSALLTGHRPLTRTLREGV